MSDVQRIKDLLFHELDLIVRTSSGLISRIQKDQWTYRPVETMRNLKELVQHLVLVPAQDLAILQEKPEEEVRLLSGELAEVTEADKLIKVMGQGTKDLKVYMNQLSDNDFMRKATRPFYLEYSSVQVKWLIEIVTHAQHHRAQVFTYMKQQGHDISMDDLY